MQSIWPSRTIKHSTNIAGPSHFSVGRVNQIREALKSFGRLIDEPTILRADTQAVALLHLGTDDVGGNSSLLVHVTNTVSRIGAAVHLEVLPYGAIGGSDKKRYTPSTASQKLDQMVEQVSEVLSDVIERSDWR